ncbi:MAG: DNA polymerase I [Candidatus Omnitrophota bacterium]|nr:MAG: DNA polymerase I [Candidatus Omnitrophota bacterium]
MDKILYLVDGTSICYRSFFAIRLSTSKGFPTGAIYGFINTLKKIIKKYQPHYLVVCFDVSRKTFRQEKFKAYKIQRPPLPDSLKKQIPVIKELTKALGIKVIEKEGWEADDLIASLARKGKEENFKVIIIGSDKDIFQLIENKKIYVYDPVKDILYDEETFLKEFSFHPSQMVDYLSLVGDSTDNVPGAKGIGKVGATKLIKEFKTIENLFDNLDKVPSSVKKILVSNRENIFLSKSLVKLAYIDLDFSWEDLVVKEPNYLQVYRHFRELEFTSFLKDIPSPSLNIKVEVRKKIHPQFVEKIKHGDELIFYPSQEKVYVTFKDNSFVCESSLEEIKQLLQDSKVRKVSYDFKNILHTFKGKVKLEGIWFDTKIAAYILNPTLGDFSLKNLVAHFLNVFTQDFPPSVACYFIRELYKTLYDQIKAQFLERLFFSVEMPLIEVLWDMESWGIKVDKKFLKDFSREVKGKIAKLKEDIYKAAGEEFNINSPQQLSRILFQKLKLPPLKRTKTGFSTNEEVLTKLAQEYPIAKLLLEYRQLNKLSSTYLEPFLREVELKNGRIFAKFHQTKTATGRLSSSSPNIQNLPIKSEISKGFRRAIISSFDEGLILCCDYSQIELRILAHFSEDEKLIEAFRGNLDIHRHTASLLFGISPHQVSWHQRELAKRVNFGIIYGMSPFGLAQELNISIEEAFSFIESYFLRYPKVKEYIERVCQEAEKRGFVETILGRRRPLPLESLEEGAKEFAKRVAINTPIQGSAADIIKMAMIEIYRGFKKEKLNSKMIIQIHDELVFDVEKSELRRIIELAKEKMEKIVELKVPLKVNVKVGKNWLDTQEVR